MLPLVIVALCPPALGALLDRMLALLHRAPLERRPSFPGLARAVAWNLAGWLRLREQRSEHRCNLLVDASPDSRGTQCRVGCVRMSL